MEWVGFGEERVGMGAWRHAPQNFRIFPFGNIDRCEQTVSGFFFFDEIYIQRQRRCERSEEEGYILMEYETRLYTCVPNAARRM